MKTYREPITLAGLKREELRHWWATKATWTEIRNNVGVYNDGNHLYLYRGFPGTFIKPPTLLQFFPFRQSVKEIGNITLIHVGHTFGLGGGVASLIALCDKTILRLQILPLNMAHIIVANNVFKWKFERMNLPPTVLQPVLFSH